MEENKFEIEEIKEDAVVEETAHSFKIEAVSENDTSADKDDKEEPSKLDNITANLNKKPFTKEYVSGFLFIALAVATLIIGFVVEGYTVVGIICFLLASLAAYTMLNHVYECKKAQTLLDTNRASTVSELMTAMKKRRKYEFMRSLGGMIRDGHLVGYEIIDGEKIRRIENN